MKRYGFLTLIFLAMVVAIELTSCAQTAGKSPVPTVGQAVSTTQAAALPAKAAVGLPAAQEQQSTGVQPAAEQRQPKAAATSIPTLTIPVTAPTQAPAAVDAQVTADSLNMRVGPGMNHRIMAKLAAGQIVRLEGRSQTGAWLAVRLADGREGWVSSSYLRVNGSLASLPMLEAYGGPLAADPAAQTQPTAKPGRRYKLNVSINYNQVEVSMSGFEAERNVDLRLAVPGEDLAVTVASTKTDTQGSANLTFDMPTSWPDGSAITQNALELQVLGADGKMVGKARITYQAE